MAGTVLTYDNTDNDLAKSHLAGVSPTLPIVIPAISDAADITEAFNGMWKGTDSVSAVGVGGYIWAINDRLKNVESAIQPFTDVITPPQAVNFSFAPHSSKFILVNEAATSAKARFALTHTSAATNTYYLPDAGGNLVTESKSQPLTNKAIGAGSSIDSVVIGGTTPAAGTFTTVGITQSTASTSKDTGALIVQSGGLGVEGAVFAGGKISTLGQLESTVAQGTAPLVVTSTIKVANLNADLLDDQTGSYYLDWGNFSNIPASVTNLIGGTINATTITADSFNVTNFEVSGTTTYTGADIKSGGVDAAVSLVDTMTLAEYPVAEYVISLKTTGATTVYKALVAAQGTNADVVVYGENNVGAALTATITAASNGTNVTVTITPTQTCDIRYFRVSTKAAAL